MIRLKGINRSFPAFRLGPVDLSIPQGSFFMLMGPTGSGKTLILEIIAGLTGVEEGRVEISGRNMNSVKPGRRGVGIVYQDSALFPHLTVEENISYGLKWGRKGGLGVTEIVEMLDLGVLLNRLPGKLSGGEKQRTALARALATNPSVMLLDEPMSSLDQQFRGYLRRELKTIHSRTETTFVMATHDFTDAVSLGTAGAVVNNGQIVQQGSIDDIFFKPSNPFMAVFTGMKNLIPVVYEGGRAVTIDGLSIDLPEDIEAGKGSIAVPQESISVSKKLLREDETNRFKGQVTEIVREGYGFIIEVTCRTTVFSSMLTPDEFRKLSVKQGDTVQITWDASSTHCFKNELV